MCWYPCWVCTGKHLDDDFPRVNSVPITYGGMGGECRRIYESLPPLKKQRVRLTGIARYEAMQARSKTGTRVT